MSDVTFISATEKTKRKWIEDKCLYTEGGFLCNEILMRKPTDFLFLCKKSGHVREKLSLRQQRKTPRVLSERFFFKILDTWDYFREAHNATNEISKSDSTREWFPRTRGRSGCVVRAIKGERNASFVFRQMRQWRLVVRSNAFGRDSLESGAVMI